jgi:hypothetical protein
MNAATLVPPGLPASLPGDHRLQLPLSQFFATVNWDDQPPASPTAAAVLSENHPGPLSLSLRVEHFLGSINWEGTGSVAVVQTITEPPPSSADFTLEGFSELF